MRDSARFLKLLGFGCAMAAGLAGCGPQPEPEEEIASPTPTPVSAPGEAATPTPTPGPTPTPVIPRKRMEVSKLFNEMRVESRVIREDGGETAAVDRRADESYTLELTVRARIPVAARTLEQIRANDPGLPDALSGLESLIENANVSPWFGQLYDLKIQNLERGLGRIDTLLSKHNFYDCDTVLEIENPATGRKALLLMGDMDVNTDGSDGDRNFDIDGSSMFFQPQTSFRWRKRTDRPNQFLERFEKRLAEFQEEYAIVGLPAERNRELEAGIRHAEATLYEMRTFSFLIAGADPYIVLPIFMIRETEGEFAPRIGDYAVVVYDGVAYPTLVGDAGPSFKFGEASTRMCLQVNPRSSPISRPISSLRATYLVFPGTRDEEPGPPDLAKWRELCEGLLEELGLKAAVLHDWEDLIEPWPTPTPEPTPDAASLPGLIPQQYDIDGRDRSSETGVPAPETSGPRTDEPVGPPAGN